MIHVIIMESSITIITGFYGTSYNIYSDWVYILAFTKQRVKTTQGQIKINWITVVIKDYWYYIMYGDTELA